VLVHTIASPFFTGPLRSPARLQNTFAHESFIDEVAALVRADPVQYRLRRLVDQRLIDVLNAAARGANWETRPSPKPGNSRTGVVTGRGIACVLYGETTATAAWWRRWRSIRQRAESQQSALLQAGIPALSRILTACETRWKEARCKE
jgi:CO/xanthine dehydrogenase Mo-binding subunit